MAKLSTADRIKQSRVSIMKHPRFCAFSGVLSCGELTLDVTLNPPTACTNGWDIKFHPDFVDSLDDPQLRLLMLHEAVHAAYRHLTVWKTLWKIDRNTTNIAADHFVNLALIDMDNGESFITMPSVGVQPNHKYRGWSVQQIFDDLMQQGSGKGKGSGNGQGDDDPLDSHDWEGAETDAKTEATRAQEIDRALRQGEMVAKKRGAGNGGANGLIADLLAPKVDWAQQLQDFVQETCAGHDTSTWRRPNRRYIADDIYLPTMLNESMGELVVSLDTSGSCFDSGTVTRFVSELKAAVAAVTPERVRVLCWDWEVRSDQCFERDEFAVPALEVRGGGGTSGRVTFDHIKAKGYQPQAIIMFTDGDVGDWGESDVPTLWVVTEKRNQAPWGRTIHMPV